MPAQTFLRARLWSADKSDGVEKLRMIWAYDTPRDQSDCAINFSVLEPDDQQKKSPRDLFTGLPPDLPMIMHCATVVTRREWVIGIERISFYHVVEHIVLFFYNKLYISPLQKTALTGICCGHHPV